MSAGEQLEAARAAWPGVEVPPREFAGYRAERAAKGGADQHLGDLYLACGCARGDAAAIAHLDGRFLSQVRGFLTGIDTSADFVDEVRQALRENLLVGGDPGIAAYAGRGPLSQWLRITAQRLALNLRRGRKPQASLADDQRVTAKNPELDYIRKHSQREFSRALQAALATLEVHERNLLRLHFVDGLSTAELAPLFHAHRTTIRRQINGCQERLMLAMRDSLRERLRLSDSQLESLLREGRKSLDLSLSKLL